MSYSSLRFNFFAFGWSLADVIAAVACVVGGVHFLSRSDCSSRLFPMGGVCKLFPMGGARLAHVHDRLSLQVLSCKSGVMICEHQLALTRTDAVLMNW